MPVLNRLFRPACAVCSLAPGPICVDCEEDFFPADRRRCGVCAIRLHGEDLVCGRCLSSPPGFHRATALADYAPPVDAMVQKGLADALPGQAIPFAFKHFQAIPEAGRFAELRLPEGFVPREVKVAAEVQGEKPLLRTFKWGEEE